jgi:hypothetical protein
MDKDARRRKRKEKDRDRERRQAIDNTPFDNKKRNYRDALLRLYRRAKDEYASLLKVIEIDATLQLRDQEVLDYSGLGKRFKTVFFDQTADDGYSKFEPAYKGNFPMGGATQVVSNHSGQHGTIVIMKRSTVDPDLSDFTNSPSTAISPEGVVPRELSVRCREIRTGPSARISYRRVNAQQVDAPAAHRPIPSKPIAALIRKISRRYRSEEILPRR